MGENKASYLTKSYVEKIPASDQKDVHELKTGVGNAAGGALQNPLGKFVCCALTQYSTLLLLTPLLLGWQHRGRSYQASYWSLSVLETCTKALPRISHLSDLQDDHHITRQTTFKRSTSTRSWRHVTSALQIYSTILLRS